MSTKLTVSWIRASVVIMTLAFLVSDARGQETAFDLEARYRVAIGDAPIRGPRDALVTVIEYSDFACPYCRRAQDTLNLLQHLFPDEVRIVFRHNPLDEEEGTLSAEASMAAHEEGLFWPMHDRIFDAGGLVSRSQLEGFAMELGLDMTRFRQALDERRFREAVQRDARDAFELGIRSTPMFFINGRPIRGALPLRVFVDRVRQELEHARGLLERGVPRSRVYETVMASARERADAEPGSDRVRAPGLDDSRAYQVGLGLPGHSLGPDDALVTVVVFSDFQCPFCRKMVPALYALRAEYKDELRLVFRHQPLSFHPDAQLASEAALAAAAQGRFWEMHDLLYQHQDRLERAQLHEYARRAGLDMARFSSDMDDHRHANAVHTERAVASALGVVGTPTMFVNGVPVSGARSYDYIKYVYIEPALTSARTLVEAGVPRSDIYALATRMRAGLGEVHRSTSTQVGEQVGEPVDGLLEQESSSELMRSCSERDDQQAGALYQELGSDAEREKVRAYCQPYGVDLGE